MISKMGGAVVRFPDGRVYDRDVVKRRNREAESKFLTGIRRTLQKFPEGIPLETFPEQFYRVTGGELNLEGLGFVSMDEMFEKMEDVVVINSGRVFDRVVLKRIERQKREEEEVFGILEGIYGELVSKEKEYVTIEEVKRRFAEAGIFKDNKEVMQLLWVQHRDYFKADKVVGETDLVTKALTEEDGKSESRNIPEAIPERFQWEKFPLSSEDLETLAPDGRERFIQVAMSQYNSPLDIWINLEANIPKIEAIMNEMASVYEDETSAAKYKVPLGELREGMPCAAVYGEYGWHRAEVGRILSDRKLELLYVDYGSVDRVPTESVRLLEGRFLRLPAQAIQISLPFDRVTSEEAVLKKIHERFFEFLSKSDKVWAYGIQMREDGKVEAELVLQDEDGVQIGITQAIEQTEYGQKTELEDKVSVEELIGFGFGEQPEPTEKGPENSGEEAEKDLIDFGAEWEETQTLQQEQDLIELGQEDEDRVDFGKEWEEEIEEELESCVEDEEEAEEEEGSDFVPADPDPTLEGMTIDEALLGLRVREIQRMRLTQELCRDGLSDEQKADFSAELDQLDSDIREMEDFLVKLGDKTETN